MADVNDLLLINCCLWHVSRAHNESDFVWFLSRNAMLYCNVRPGMSMEKCAVYISLDVLYLEHQYWFKSATLSINNCHIIVIRNDNFDELRGKNHIRYISRFPSQEIPGTDMLEFNDSKSSALQAIPSKFILGESRRRLSSANAHLHIKPHFLEQTKPQIRSS